MIPQPVSATNMDLGVTEICSRQELFCTTVKAFFLTKLSKYQNILMKNGIHLHELHNDTNTKISRSQSFEEHMELVIGQKSVSPNAYKSLFKIGNHISAVGLFRWIYQMVQRTKSTRILQHLDGIPEVEVQSVVLAVAREIATAFEYQLCMLEGESEVSKLGQHAVLCMLAYLNTADAHFGPEELIKAVLEVKPHSSRNKDILKTRPVMFNDTPVCLRWRLNQILKQPGLRILPIPTIIHLTDDELIRYENLSESKNGGKNSKASISGSKGFGSPSKGSGSGPSTGVDEVDSSPRKFKAGIDGVKKAGNHDVVVVESKLGNSPSKHQKVIRKISTVEMDFDQGFMKVTDHHCEVSDFSPVGNCTQLLEDGEECRDVVEAGGDDTDVDEELEMDSERADDKPIAGKPDKTNIDKVNVTEVETAIGKHNASMETGNVGENVIAKLEENNRSKDLLSNELDGQDDVDSAIKVHTIVVKESQSAIDTRDNHEMCNDVDKTQVCHIKTNIMCSEPGFSNGSGTPNRAINPNNEIRNNEITTSSAKTVKVNSIETTAEIVTEIIPASSNQESHVADVLVEEVDAADVNSTRESNHAKGGNFSPRHQQCHADLKITPAGAPENLQGSKQTVDRQESRDIKASNATVDIFLASPGCSQATVQSDSTCTQSISEEERCILDKYGNTNCKFYGCFTPYGAKCRPQVYGFRGPLHVWNEKEGRYSLIYNDKVTVATLHKREVSVHPDNFHQAYVPKTLCEH